MENKDTDSLFEYLRRELNVIAFSSQLSDIEHIIKRTALSYNQSHTEPEGKQEPEVKSIHKLMDAFAQALKDKSAKVQEKYGYGDDDWKEDTSWEETCRKELSDHVLKGDPRDVAIYCAFAWYHGWNICPAPQQIATNENAVEIGTSEDLIGEMQDAMGSYRNTLNYSAGKSCARIAEKHAEDKAKAFLDSIRAYEHENGCQICYDDRTTDELFQIFKNSTK